MSGPRSPAIRAALGIGQMAGAVAGLFALLGLGITWVAVGIIIGTSVLTVTSRILFPRTPDRRQ